MAELHLSGWREVGDSWPPLQLATGRDEVGGLGAGGVLGLGAGAGAHQRQATTTALGSPTAHSSQLYIQNSTSAYRCQSNIILQDSDLELLKRWTQYFFLPK